ncbi:bifunctional demethylmenaquinone methyltransferase/2-methoxy-6-polyprenyl-1,4-benzoquinol methylase UbiE [Clostridium frigoris]|uniref:Demethylmenaquinone methyltransferase n=1 Tax=Clostridium frigoris TaxID=205327 RepID=A0ABS6BQR0_9CLOT|nr:bifunctional demethylmenaquinone methyltransferase/2-methoxy-6-polyprenyl-1,4-benzoquinol methylase UbiE [Clostridium frigoris]MBU3158349.1 bifunctional demethylmenaquinone methyltransferase/2-methoxy-6-polyprenyl-1,4-benzoquinol methylase UbiE [Clostridium frigoris]
MSEMITDVQSVFSSIASKYDKLNTILTLNIDKIWRKKAVKLCTIKENDRVLDLCCGTGKMVELECRAVGENTEVVGLDFNKEMLDVGYKNLNKSLTNYKFSLMQGDAMELPFEDSTFNCITIAFGLRNIPNKRKSISEMYRVLKPGGKVVCLELSKPEIPIFRNVYNLYFNYVLPVIGYLGTQDKAAYYYLRDSVNGFMTKKQLRHEFKNVGFENSEFKSLTCGIASIHYGIKPL